MAAAAVCFSTNSRSSLLLQNCLYLWLHDKCFFLLYPQTFDHLGFHPGIRRSFPEYPSGSAQPEQWVWMDDLFFPLLTSFDRCVLGVLSASNALKLLWLISYYLNLQFLALIFLCLFLRRFVDTSSLRAPADLMQRDRQAANDCLRLHWKGQVTFLLNISLPPSPSPCDCHGTATPSAHQRCL